MRYSNGAAVDIISDEGIGYAVLDYTSAARFSDTRTAELWAAAAIALGELESWLAADTGREEVSNRDSDISRARKELKEIQDR